MGLLSAAVSLLLVNHLPIGAPTLSLQEAVSQLIYHGEYLQKNASFYRQFVAKAPHRVYRKTLEMTLGKAYRSLDASLSNACFCPTHFQTSSFPAAVGSPKELATNFRVSLFPDTLICSLVHAYNRNLSLLISISC